MPDLHGRLHRGRGPCAAFTTMQPYSVRKMSETTSAIARKPYECPECRKKHRAVNNEVTTFPQNKYILVNVRRRQEEFVKNKQNESSENVNICEKHGKQLSLYCKGPECSTTICQTCFTRSHRGEGHDVVETEEIEKEALQQEMGVVIKRLQERRRLILEADNKNSECVQKITDRRDHLIEIVTQRCDQLLAQVNNESMQEDSSDKLKVIEAQLDLLHSIKENADKEVITHEVIESNRETMISIQNKVPELANTVFEFEVTERTADSIDRFVDS